MNDAARAYHRAARKEYEPFAVCNFPDAPGAHQRGVWPRPGALAG